MRKTRLFFSSLLFFQLFYSILLIVLYLSLLYPIPISPDYTAGELLDHFLAWFEKGTLYSSIQDSPYRVLNYPPLFFIFVSGIHKIGFSILSSGRIVTILFFILGIGVLFRWMKQLGQTSKITWGLIALLGTSFPVFYNVGQWSLQWPAVTLSLLGLYLIQNPTRISKIVLGAFFCALACFIKQTQVVAALIGFIWLFKYHRSKSFWFLIALFFAGIIGSLFLQFYFGNEFWKQIITYTVGTFSSNELLKQLACHLLPWIIFFSLGIFIGFKNREERKNLRWWYFIGTTLSLLSSARLGASHQYFLEWTLATLLWIGPWLANRLQGIGKREQQTITGTLSPLLCFLLFFQIIAADIGVSAILFTHIKKLKNIEKQLPQICELLGEAKLVPTGDPGLVRTCGKIPALQPFIMTNLSKKKLWDQEPFLQELNRGNYPIILLPFDLQQEIRGVHLERWTLEMIQAMRKNYRIREEIGEWRIYQWKES